MVSETLHYENARFAQQLSATGTEHDADGLYTPAPLNTGGASGTAGMRGAASHQ